MMISGSLVSASAYAASRASWPKPLISPRRSSTTPPGSWRTLASRWLACIVVSFQVYDQLDGVVVGVSRDAQLVDHVLDQEQAPAPRSLRARQLGLQVRNLRVRARWRTTTPVDDAHQETLLQAPYLDHDRDFGSVPVAVLHGVHRRLGHGGLEPLQGSLRQPELHHGASHLLHRPALVAGLAGHAQLGERPPGSAPGGLHSSSDLSRVIRVMSSSCSQSSPVKRVSSERRKPISEEPPERWVPTRPCSRGKPNISRRASCASTRPSL